MQQQSLISHQPIPAKSAERVTRSSQRCDLRFDARRYAGRPAVASTACTLSLTLGLAVYHHLDSLVVWLITLRLPSLAPTPFISSIVSDAAHISYDMTYCSRYDWTGRVADVRAVTL